MRGEEEGKGKLITRGTCKEGWTETHFKAEEGTQEGQENYNVTRNKAKMGLVRS